MACAQKNPQLLAESKTVRGRERTTYWCMLAILYFPFSILSSFFLSFFSLPFLSQCLLVCCDSLLEVAITVFVIVILPLPTVHGRGPLYNACCDQILLFQLLTTFVWSGCPCRPLTGLPVAQPPPLTCAGRATRQRRLFCLFVCRDILTYYGVGALSLSLSLMACTQWFQLILTSFGQYVIPARHFPQKSLSRNPKIGFPLSLPLDYALLPLTYDLTTSCISWVQAGDVWALCVLHFHEHPKSACCSRVHHGLKACLHILPPILGFLWCEPFSGFSFFKACSFQGWAFVWSQAFHPSAHSLALFCSLCISCHTTLLFLLWCYLIQACWASLGLLLILPLMTQYNHLGFLVMLLAGSCVPFSFQASLVHLLSLGLFSPFPNSAFPWVFTNSFGLP